MPVVTRARDDIKAFRADYLATRFGLTVAEARAFKEGRAVTVNKDGAEKICAQGFGIETVTQPKTTEPKGAPKAEKKKG